MAATSRDSASPSPSPPIRVTRNRFLRQAVGGLAIAAVGLKTVGEQTALAAVTFGETVSGIGAWGVKILNSSSANNATGINVAMNATTPGTDSAAVRGLNKGTNTNSHGIWGSHSGKGNGVYGSASAPSGTGVRGLHSAISGISPGVRGETASMESNAAGVLGYVSSDNAGTESAGVIGANNGLDGNAYGVLGTATSGTGVRGMSDAYGVSGEASASGGYGVYGAAFGEFGTGVEGLSNNIGVSGWNVAAGHFGRLGTPTEGAIGVRYNPSTLAVITTGKLGTATDGVYGSAKGGTGVRGVHTATTGVAPGVRGDTSSLATNAVAVLGTVTPAAAGQYSAGVKGVNNGTNSESYGVLGTSVAGKGVRGEAPFSGVSGASSIGTGVEGTSAGVTGTGVYGAASSGTGANFGVIGEAYSSEGTGVEGRSNNIAVSGQNHGSSRRGRLGTASEGVIGEQVDPVDLETVLTHGKLGAANDGVFGRSDVDSGNGVVGVANGGGTPYGVWGEGPANGYAGYFSGDVHVTGNLSLDGAISAPTKHFLIDHPLDPANQYLTHASVETSELLNLYRGNITLDDDGAAAVTLPAWFAALNGDHSYQLTAIGAPPQDLHVSQKIHENRFTIAGGTAGSEVSWQVTGVRQDAYARANPMQVERAKPKAELGTYLHPEAHGQAKGAGLAAIRLHARKQAASVRP